MEHAARLVVVHHDFKAIAVRLAVVHDHGQLTLNGERELPLKHLLLQRLVLGVPVIVQPDLPDGDHLRLRAERAQQRYALAVPALPFLRVPAHGGVYERELLRERARRAGAFTVAAGIDDERNALCRHRGENFPPVGVEFFVVIVGVGIKDHGAHLPLGHILPRERSLGKLLSRGGWGILFKTGSLHEGAVSGKAAD